VSGNEDRASSEARPRETEATTGAMRVEINWSANAGDEFMTWLRRAIRIRGGRHDDR